MQRFSLSPVELVSSFWRHHSLITALTKRDIAARYRGSLIGIFWSFVNPVLMLSVYTFVFGVVFKARWGGGGESKTEFALVLFAGLMVYNFFSECLIKAPGLVVSNANYVKKVVFPLEILPWVLIGSALFHTMVSFTVWLLFYAILFGAPQVTIFLFPVVVVPLVLVAMGAAWALASLGVYLRDISQFIGVLTLMLMFLSPIFYPATALPEKARQFLFLNPLTPAVEESRQVLFWGVWPDYTMLGAYGVVSLLVAWLGFAWFQRTRKGFADVI